MEKLLLCAFVLLSCLFVCESLRIIKRPRDVCTQPLKPGPCKAALPRYYYDTKTELCKSFKWGGCQENGNNFKSKKDCVRRCGCRAPSKTGRCKAHFRRYFYDIKTRRCTSFVYGGCQANENNFRTLHLCNRTCRPRREETIGFRLIKSKKNT